MSFVQDFTFTYVLYPYTTIYRVVTHIKDNYVEDYKCENILATMVGTSLPRLGSESGNRMSDKGEMVFCGALNQDVCIKEVEKDPTGAGEVYYTIGKFHTNKRVRLIDFSKLYGFNKPSVFDIEHADERRHWFFLKHFMENISIPVDENDYKGYKLTQVLGKYIQLEKKFKGIAYPSSKFEFTDTFTGTIASEMCIAMFVDNFHCIDEGKKNGMIL